jgi:coproporphyrinogen III oxidase-like Fe-S oxidoreductase
VLDAWRERGLLAEGSGRVRLTEAGFLLSDTLFAELL